jgi:hypothetical protein
VRIWLHDRDFVRWFKPLVGLADVAASVGGLERAARLIGVIDEMLRSLGMGLTPTDTPAYERATTAVRTAIGTARFAALTEAGAGLDADGWLAESSAVVDAARNHQQR